MLDISHDSIYYEKNGGSIEVIVTSNTNWTISSNQSWITVNPDNGTNNGSFSVTVPENNGPARSGIVTISSDGISHNILLNQKGEANLIPVFTFKSLRPNNLMLSSNATNSNAIVLTQDNENPKQKWDIVDLGDEIVKIINNDNGKVLTAEIDTHQANVTLADWEDTDLQKWKLTLQTGENIYVVRLAADIALRLDNGGAASNSNVLLNSDAGVPDEWNRIRWEINRTEIKADTTTYSKEMKQKINDFVLYPNPASRKVTIKGTGNYKASLYSIQGSLVLKADNLSAISELDISNQKEGFYIMKISNSEMINAMPFVIKRK